MTILDAIGNTPIVQLWSCVPANGAEVWVKLEYVNPTGSMKDRMALAPADTPFAMQGWAGFEPPQWDAAKVDAVEAIRNHEATGMMLRLAREEGVFAGVSTCANVVGALQLAERLGPDAVVVTLAVDSGLKYMTASPLAEL